MMGKIKKLGIYLSIALFGLGLIMLKAGLKNDNSIFIFLGIGLMLVVAILLGIYFVSSGLKQVKYEKQYQNQLSLFKLKAREILVNLETLEIKSNNWTETIIDNDINYGLMYAAAGNHESNLTKVNRNLNTLKISIPVDGNTIEYLVNIEMEPTTLAMHFAIKKETFLYVYRNESYLDLDF